MQLTRRSLLIGSAAAGAATIAVAQTPVLHLLGYAQQPQPRQSSGRRISVREFGVRGNAVGDDGAAIQGAIDSLASAGGGTLVFPSGIYLASRAGESAVALTLKSGVFLEGEGSGSVLRLADGSGGHLFNVLRESNCGIRNMLLDGNRTRQPSSGHVFRSGGVTALTLSDLIIRNGFHYGIGFEGGTNRNVVIDNVLIEDCGGDGIDIKNMNDDDAAIAISNVTVRRWGLRADRQTQAAIDCRGSTRLTNIRVSEPGAADSVGVRMRPGELHGRNGLGGHYSTLDGFDIRMGDGRVQVGLSVGARHVSISNGSVSSGRRGLMVQDSGFRGTNLRVRGCSEVGILVDAHGGGLDGDDAMLSQCLVSGCGGDGITVEADGVQLLGCASTGNRGHGLRILGTASATRVVGGDFSGNGAGPIADAGANSRIAAGAT